MVNLKDFKEQTDKILKLNDMVLKKTKDFIEYDVPKGTAIGFSLYNIPLIAVQRVFMSKGTVNTFDLNSSNLVRSASNK